MKFVKERGFHVCCQINNARYFLLYCACWHWSVSPRRYRVDRGSSIFQDLGLVPLLVALDWPLYWASHFCLLDLLLCFIGRGVVLVALSFLSLLLSPSFFPLFHNQWFVNKEILELIFQHLDLFRRSGALILHDEAVRYVLQIVVVRTALQSLLLEPVPLMSLCR